MQQNVRGELVQGTETPGTYCELSNIHNIRTNILFLDQCQTHDNESAFSWVDYTVLGAMLFISCGIGVFYGFFAKKHENSHDFLLGGSSMGTFPMAMSLAARLANLII